MAHRHPEPDRVFVERQRQRLEALRRQLTSAESTAVQERILRAGRAAEAREFEENAQDMAARETDEGVHRADERRLRAIVRALRMIEEGTYGLSDVSGKPIPRARLDAVPEAVLKA